MNKTCLSHLICFFMVTILVTRIRMAPHNIENEDRLELTSDEQVDDLVLAKYMCVNLMESDAWSLVKKSVRQICLKLANESSYNRERRFFALQVGKNVPHPNVDTSNKGFKYGRK